MLIADDGIWIMICYDNDNEMLRLERWSGGDMGSCSVEVFLVCQS
jgi:hypothetical protein